MRHRICLTEVHIVWIMSAIVLAVVPAGAADAPSKATIAAYRKLVAAAQKAHAAKAYDKAIELSRKAAGLLPQSSTPLYNIACAFALQGKKKEALESLRQAVSKGFDQVDLIRRDPDLESLRQEADFEALVKQVAVAAAANAPKEEVLRPAEMAPGTKCPLVVFLHGTGGNAQDFVARFQPLVDADKWIVYLPCGSVRMGRRHTDGKPAHNWRARSDAERIVGQVKALVDSNEVDRERIYVAGFSAGGAMSYMLGIQNPDLFRGILVFSGTMQKGMLSKKQIDSAAGKIPVFATHGTQDKVIPCAVGKRAFDALKKAGYKGTWREHGGVHWLPPEFLKVLKDATAAMSAIRAPVAPKQP